MSELIIGVVVGFIAANACWQLKRLIWPSIKWERDHPGTGWPTEKRL